MAWYVFALVDAVPSGRPGKGLAGQLSTRRIPGGLAIVERRADVPPLEFGTLERHQAVVSRLAASVPAILPVRFGTLLEAQDIEEALQDRDEEIAEAFDLVRGKVQFTWRQRAGGAKGLPRRSREAAKADLSGAEYLRRAARAARPAPPAAFRAVRTALRRLVSAERYQAAGPAVPSTLYHLVEKTSASRYAVLAEAVRHANPLLTMTGPFPPFAFAPEVL